MPKLPIACLLLGFLLGIIFCGAIYRFNSAYKIKWQSPIVVQTPVWLEKRGNPAESSPSSLPKPEPSRLPEDLVGEPRVYKNKPQTDMDILNTLKHASIVKKIYALESSQGLNDGCKTKGLFNGFGFMQQDDHDPWMCFASLKEVAEKVDSWLETQLSIKTLPQALCYYQSGTPSNDCKYYQKFLALK